MRTGGQAVVTTTREVRLVTMTRSLGVPKPGFIVITLTPRKLYRNVKNLERSRRKHLFYPRIMLIRKKCQHLVNMSGLLRHEGITDRYLLCTKLESCDFQSGVRRLTYVKYGSQIQTLSHTYIQSKESIPASVFISM